MQELNCLIVEDERLAADVISDYIRQVPGLKLVGICEDVFSAMEKLRSEKIQIIFLDIDLPRINGLDFIKTLNSRYHIILTTAYHQYALDGFNLNAVDYLLKPVEFSRFLQAVNKVFERIETPQTVNPSSERKFYFFNSDRKRVKVFADEIIYIESIKDYIKIHTGEKSITTKVSIGDIEGLLNDPSFLRVHKSFVINCNKITAYNSTDIELGDVQISIGRTYSEAVARRMGQ